MQCAQIYSLVAGGRTEMGVFCDAESALMESVIRCPYTCVISPAEEEAISEGGDRHWRHE